MKRKIKRLLNVNKGKLIIYLIIMVLFIVSSTFISISLIKLSGIETTLRIIALFLIVIYLFYYILKGYKFLVNKNKVKYWILCIITLILSIIFLILSYFIGTVYGEIGNLTEKDDSLYTGYLISLQDQDESLIKKSGIIKNTLDVEGYKIAKEIISDNNLDYELITYDNYEDMIADLYNKTIEGAFVQSNYVSYFEYDENYKNINNETKIIYKKTIESKNTNLNLSSNKTLKEPFTILLMGVDSTENNINATDSFNGDTLMLITLNPKTLNATVFSIPRDLYVPISCRKGAKAKINSSTVGGTTCVLETIEDLIDIKIDYYAKINFRGVVDLVDALKGIDVEVTNKFCEQDSERSYANQICLDKGYQHLNGEQALAYARHRHTLPTGDLMRIQNQQLIVEAMSKKLLSLNTVTDFKDILSAISNNIVTNLSREQILSSYNILKNMVINLLSSQDALVIEKAYLEVYDMNVYNEKSGLYLSSLGYYEDSLNEIIKTMKVNLELEEASLIKEFTFDANTPYIQKVAGKDIKNTVNNVSVPNFIGKMVSEADEFGNLNNITINKEYVNSENSHYNSDVNVGLIGGQSIMAGTNLNNINSITIYINNAS